jgi:hypothetical protein
MKLVLLEGIGKGLVADAPDEGLLRRVLAAQLQP